jgi:hypothetical protein
MKVRRYLCGSPRHLPHPVYVQPYFVSLKLFVFTGLGIRLPLTSISVLKYFLSNLGFRRKKANDGVYILPAEGFLDHSVP